VQAQRRDPNSLLNYLERMIRTRQEYPEFSTGTYGVLETSEPTRIFAHSCSVRRIRWDKIFAAGPLFGSGEVGQNEVSNGVDKLFCYDPAVTANGPFQLKAGPESRQKDIN
jgi:hypothetical protein